MKKETFKFNLISTIFAFAIFFIVSCTAPEKKDNSLASVYEQQKEEALDGLKKQQDKVDEAIEDLKDKANIGESSLERNFEKTQNDLEKKKKELADKIEETQNTTEEEWDEFKKNLDKSITQFNKDMEQLQDDIVEEKEELIKK